MSLRILVAYATRYGSTEEVAATMATTLRDEFGLEVDLRPMREVDSLDGYGAVILGVPLYIGSWPKDADRFLFRHETALRHRPMAIFALGPISDDPEEIEGSYDQLGKELAHYPWLEPLSIEVFVGKYDPEKLRFPDNLLALLPASPLHGKPASDLRDWTAIHAWVKALGERLQLVVA